MAFNPDEYLAKKSSPQAEGFNPDAYLASKAPAEEPGLLKTAGNMALSGLGKAAEFVDRYTGAPVRAGIYAAQGGENPVSAYGKQFGEDSTMAPSGKDIVMRAGVKDEMPKKGIQPKFVEEEEKKSLGPAYDKYQENKSNGPTPADVLGVGMDVAADPSLLMTGAGKALPRAAKALAPIGEGAKGIAQKGIAEMSHLTSGVPAGAAERLMQRPSQVFAAGKEGAALDIGERARNEFKNTAKAQGAKIGEAKKGFLEQFGNKTVDTTPVIDNLNENLSRKGLLDGEEGALSKGEISSLEKLQNSRLQTPSEAGAINQKPAGSLQHFSDYLDSKIKSFDQKIAPGSSRTPYQAQLVQTRGQVKDLLHNLDTEGLKKADAAYHDYAKKADTLGRLEDPNQMESFINNFYGKNKSLMRENAQGIIPNSIEDIKDLSAAKGFNVTGPSGSHAGLRNMMSFGMMGKGAIQHDPLQILTGLALQPQVQKQILGRGAQGLELLDKNPALKPALRGGLINVDQNRGVNRGR
jgi:hypothetical protein